MEIIGRANGGGKVEPQGPLLARGFGWRDPAGVEKASILHDLKYELRKPFGNNEELLY